MRFSYHKVPTLVEPHLLGNARRSHAFILRAWRLAPEPGWDFFRYADMRDVEVLQDRFTRIREGYNPYDRKISGIDTCVRAAP